MTKIIGLNIVIEGGDKVNAEIKKTSEAIVKLGQGIREETKIRKQLQDQLKAGTLTLADYNFKIEDSKVKTKQLNAEHNKAQRELINLSNVTTTQVGAYKKLSDELTKMRQRTKDLLAEKTKLSKSDRQLIQDTRDLDAKLKKIDATTGQHQRNVGNYKQALGQLPQLFGRSGTAAQNFGRQLIALAANPIVLIIAAITGALYGLFKAFKSTEEGGLKVDIIMSKIGAIINVVTQRAALLAEALIAFFKDDFITASQKFADSFKNIGDQINAATIAAERYTIAIDDIQDREVEYISQRAKNAKKIAELEFFAADKSKGIAARKSALKEAIAIAEEQTKFEIELAEKRYNETLKNAASEKQVNETRLRRYIENGEFKADFETKFNSEEKKKLEELYAELLGIQTKFFQENKQNLSKISLFELNEGKVKADGEKAADTYINSILDRIEQRKSDEATNIGATGILYSDEELEKLDEKANEFNEQVINNDLALYEKQKANRELNNQLALQGAQQLAHELTTLSNQKTQREIDNAQSEAKSKQSSLDNQLKKGKISQAQYEAQTQALKQKTDNEVRRLRLKEFERNQRLALLDIAINTATAVAKAVALNPVAGGLPFSAIAGAIGAAQAAIVLGQQPPDFAKGGYTGISFSKRDKSGQRPAGIVHEKEWVANRKLVSNPITAPIINTLEQIQRKGFAGGGFTTPTVNTLQTQATPTQIISALSGSNNFQRIKVVNNVTDTSAQQDKVFNVTQESIF